MATCANLLSGAATVARRVDDPAWFSWTFPGTQEPGHDVDVGAFSWGTGAGAVSRG